MQLIAVKGHLPHYAQNDMIRSAGSEECSADPVSRQNTARCPEARAERVERVVTSLTRCRVCCIYSISGESRVIVPYVDVMKAYVNSTKYILRQRS